MPPSTRRVILGSLARLVVGVHGRLEVEGLEHVPRTGAVVLVFNHCSNFDPLILYGWCPREEIVGLVASEYSQRAFEAPWLAWSGALWLRRGEADRRTLARALTVLGRGGMVALAPEGGRSPNASMRRAHPGAASLAIRSGAPVLPMGIAGSDRLWMSWSRLERPRVRVRFGPTIVPPSDSGESRRARRAEFTDTIMAALADLVPPAYRGVYGSAAVEERA
jgi:1-acyl-sn-glycerol-3-phosphate acyltransferase